VPGFEKTTVAEAPTCPLLTDLVPAAVPPLDAWQLAAVP
jgi:hypothetical protein